MLQREALKLRNCFLAASNRVTGITMHTSQSVSWAILVVDKRESLQVMHVRSCDNLKGMTPASIFLAVIFSQRVFTSYLLESYAQTFSKNAITFNCPCGSVFETRWLCQSKFEMNLSLNSEKASFHIQINIPVYMETNSFGFLYVLGLA